MIRSAKIIEAETEAHQAPQPVHPLASKARVLLSSVFGPYAQDDTYGSRAMNPMELYHNQVTRVQGPFSLRMFHRSWGLMLIQANIEAPCALLDFPTLGRFVQEIRDNHYDIVGISAIPPNVLKVRKMCELIRQHLPHATILVGGHISNLSDLADRIDADHVVKGEGVRWMRRFLGENADAAINHPLISSAFGARNAGVMLRDEPGDVAATLIPSVGCPLGCNFCSTSAMFGGKGKFISFYETGDELFDVMCQLEETMQIQSFFVMDENFLLHRRRALRLLALMKTHDKAWSLYVFSSAKVLRTYDMTQLVRLGISWVWLGLEGKDSQYDKLHGVDALELVRELQSHGIRVLGSTILGMDDHTPENIDDVIDYGVRYETDFHQFALYLAVAGTPLEAELEARGVIKSESEYDIADIHGQFIFKHHHAHIRDGRETGFLLRAFDRDFQVNGPSTARIARTTLAGWKRYKNHPNACIRRRYEREARDLGASHSALVGAARLYYRGRPELRAKMSALLKDLHREFGLRSRLYATLGGRYLLRRIRKEAKRLAAGWTYEPPTFYEKSVDLGDHDVTDVSGVSRCRFVTPRAANLAAVAASRDKQAEPAIVG